MRERLTANRTRVRSGGHPKHEYILSGCIFCTACGHTLTGQVFHVTGPRYYRHGHANGPKTAHAPVVIGADRIEAAVVRELFDMFGNPAAIERAVKAAVPDCEEALKKQKRLTEELDKIGKGRDRLLDLVVKGTLTDAEVQKKLGQLKEQESTLQVALEKVNETLRNVPDKDTVAGLCSRRSRTHSARRVCASTMKRRTSTRRQRPVHFSDDDRRRSPGAH